MCLSKAENTRLNSTGSSCVRTLFAIPPISNPWGNEHHLRAWRVATVIKKIKMIWDISYCLMSPLMFYIALCCTIIPCAFMFEDPRVNSLFVAVLTSDCNVFRLKHFFPRVYVPCSAGIGAWVCQGNVFDGQSEGDGVLPVVRLLCFRLIVDRPR